MTDKHSQNRKSSKDSRKFHKTIWSDLQRGDIKKTFRREMKDIYQFYIDDDTKKRLASMNRFKRWLFISYHVFKNMIFKLTSFRRILLFISIIFAFSNVSYDKSSVNVTFDLQFLGFCMIFIILILELKDKLLAQDELAVGHAVQSEMIPDSNPELAGWDIWLFSRPAMEVGGDMVDYLKIGNSRTGMALGDIAGKGLGAALFMVKLQATIRAIAPNFKSLGEFGEQLNDIFYRDGLPQRFATLVFLAIEQNSGLVDILNAGHYPPVILQGNKLKEMPKGGAALGIVQDSKYKEQHIELKKSDMLFVYSDGIIDARNEKGEFFGEDRLKVKISLLGEYSAGEAGKRLLTTLQKYTGEAQQNDDISLLILKKIA